MSLIVTHREKRWTIAYRRGKQTGLYTGQWLTRKDAIEQHVRDKGIGNDIWITGGLTPEQIGQGWAHWRKQGDYAVKVIVEWEERVS